MIGVLYLTGIAFCLAILIVFLNSIINHSKIEEIRDMLPGYNCGACGFGSCEGFANEIIKNKDSIDKCKFIKEKNVILRKLN